MPPPICINQANPRAGFASNHSEHCAYVHRDGELSLRVSAEVHIHLNVSHDRPNGLSCMNVCQHHAAYSRDREGKEYKRNSTGLVVTDHPIVDPHAVMPPPSRSIVRTSTSMARYLANGNSSTTNNEGDNSMATKKTNKKKTTAPADSNDPDIKKLAAKQDESDERLCAGTTVKLFKRINKASKKKPVVHRTLNLYDKRLARELARLGLVIKETIDEVGLAYYAA